MRSLIVSLAITIIVPSVMATYNPDGRPSLTLGLKTISGDGKQEIDEEDQNTKISGTDFGLLFKLPSSNNITLQFGLGIFSGKLSAERNEFLAHSQYSFTEASFSFAVTFYFGSGRISRREPSPFTPLRLK